MGICFSCGDINKNKLPLGTGFFKRRRATESIDVLNRYWSNSDRNKAPIVNSFLLNNLDKKESVKIKRGKECVFTYEVIDPENDILDFEFVLMPESTDKKSGGDFEKTPEPISFKVIEKSDKKIIINSPKKLEYIGFLFIFVIIIKNMAANIPFYVK